jgi:hypothetical protein
MKPFLPLAFNGMSVKRLRGGAIASLLGAAFVFAGCGDPLDPSTIVADGQVQYLEVRGALCWAIRIDTVLYEPRPLPEDFRLDGLDVRVALKPHAERTTWCAIGPIVEVVWIRRR